MVFLKSIFSHDYGSMNDKLLTLLLLITILFGIAAYTFSRFDNFKFSENHNENSLTIKDGSHQAYVKLHLRPCSIVEFENLNYTNSSVLSISTNKLLVLKAHKFENETHQCIFTHWIVNGSIITDNPLKLNITNSSFVLVEPKYEVLAKHSCSGLLKDLLNFDNLKTFVRYESDYVRVNGEIIEFRNAFIFIPFKEPIHLYDSTCKGWLKISNVRFFVSSRTLSPKFTMVLVLNNPVKLYKKEVYALGYFYFSRSEATSYLVKEKVIFDGREVPDYAYQALMISNVNTGLFSISILDLLDKNFLPHESFYESLAVGVFVYGFDSGYLDLSKASICYGGGL